MTDIKDTSIDYDDLVGYKAKDKAPTDLSFFLDEQQDYKSHIKPKPIDPDFPEEWQNLYVNFRSEEDFIKFMMFIGETPGPKINTVVYMKNKDNGILNFF